MSSKIRGRRAILLTYYEDGYRCIEGLVLAPKGLRRKSAVKLLRRVFREMSEVVGDWSSDDLPQYLKKHGFKVIDAYIWDGQKPTNDSTRAT